MTSPEEEFWPTCTDVCALANELPHFQMILFCRGIFLNLKITITGRVYYFCIMPCVSLGG